MATPLLILNVAEVSKQVASQTSSFPLVEGTIKLTSHQASFHQKEGDQMGRDLCRHQGTVSDVVHCCMSGMPSLTPFVTQPMCGQLIHLITTKCSQQYMHMYISGYLNPLGQTEQFPVQISKFVHISEEVI